MAPADPSRADEPAEPIEVSIDEGALYVVVRKAVEDAVLGVIGTLLLVGLGLVLVWIGAAMALGARSGGPVPAVVGLAIGLIGLYIAAASLELVPPIREWF